MGIPFFSPGREFKHLGHFWVLAVGVDLSEDRKPTIYICWEHYVPGEGFHPINDMKYLTGDELNELCKLDADVFYDTGETGPSPRHIELIEKVMRGYLADAQGMKEAA